MSRLGGTHSETKKCERLTDGPFMAVLPIKRSLEMFEFSLKCGEVLPALPPAVLDCAVLGKSVIQNSTLDPLTEQLVLLWSAKTVFQSHVATRIRFAADIEHGSCFINAFGRTNIPCGNGVVQRPKDRLKFSSRAQGLHPLRGFQLATGPERAAK